MRRNCNGGILCRPGHNSLLCCIRLGDRISASNWRTGCVTNLQSLPYIQAIRGRNTVSLGQIAEIVPGNPGDVKKRITLFHGVSTATRIATFRNIPILAIVYDSPIFHLHGLFRDRLSLHGLRYRSLNGLNLRRLLRRLLRRRAHFWRRCDQHPGIGI